MNSAELIATVPVGVVTPSAATGLVVTSPGPVDIATPPALSGRVVLYELPQFGGRSLVIDRREALNLEWFGFENRAASMRIEEGYRMFCNDMSFRGDCRTLGPGEYPWLPRDLHRRITSAQRVYDVYGAAPAAMYSLR